MVKSTQPVYSWRNGRQRQSHIILWCKPCPVLILQVRQCRKAALTKVVLKGKRHLIAFAASSGNSVWQLIQNLGHMKITQHLLHVLNRLGIQENVMRLHMPQQFRRLHGFYKLGDM